MRVLDLGQRLAGVAGAPPPQPLPPGPTATGTLPCLNYPQGVTRALLALGRPWDGPDVATFFAKISEVAAAMENSPGWESLAAHAIWLVTGQQVVRVSPAAWHALARVPICPSAPGAPDTGCIYVEVEDGPKLPVRRAEGGAVILLGFYAWRRGGLVWAAPVFTDLKRKGYFRMYPFRVETRERAGFPANLLASERIATNLLRALDDHRLSRLDVVAQHDNRPRAVREADPLRPRLRRLALTADPMAVWSAQRVPAALEPAAPSAPAHHPHASPALHAVREHLALRWVREDHATEGERAAAKDAGRVRGQLVAVPRTVRPFVRGAGALRPRVTEIMLRQAG